jgi:hypothetical protein
VHTNLKLEAHHPLYRLSGALKDNQPTNQPTTKQTKRSNGPQRDQPGMQATTHGAYAHAAKTQAAKAKMHWSSSTTSFDSFACAVTQRASHAI